MKTFDVVPKEKLEHPKLTVTPTRITLKVAADLDQESVDRFTTLAQKIGQYEHPTSLRGSFGPDGSLTLSNENRATRVRFDAQGDLVADE